jgi:ABC-type dipeptide/oligopeptide/nickel transport system permease subunit
MTPDQITQILNELTTKMGPTGQQVWNIAVYQQQIIGVIGVIAAVIMLLVGIVLAAITVVMFQRYDDGGAGVITGMFSIVSFAIAFVSAIMALPILLNPQYAALMDLVGRITGH